LVTKEEQAATKATMPKSREVAGAATSLDIVALTAEAPRKNTKENKPTRLARSRREKVDSTTIKETLSYRIFLKR
jgi:ABC-type hemin transport system ATPase subunit